MKPEVTHGQTGESSFSGGRRKELSYIYSPGRKVFQIVVRMKETPGALARILDVLARRVNLIDVEVYRTDSGDAIFSGFAEGVSGSESPESLESLALSVPVALDCRVTESSDGLLVDSYHEGMETENGEPLMIFRRDAFNQMFDRLVEVFGSGASVMLMYEGVSIGESNSAELINRMGRDVVVRNMPKVIEILSASGWGKATLSMSEEGTPIIRIDDCFECSSRLRNGPMCTFMKGVLLGSAKAILGPRTTCEETRCRFRGDGYCEFSMTAG
jgi:predicted hydrocarbon binding protein